MNVGCMFPSLPGLHPRYFFAAGTFAYATLHCTKPSSLSQMLRREALAAEATRFYSPRETAFAKDGCARKVTQCPVCRQSVRDRLTVYMP